MEHNLNLPNRFAMILDPETIEGALKRAAEWKLPCRECHPLDRRSGKGASADLLRYDAEIEAAPAAEYEADAVGATDEDRPETRADADIGDGEEFDDDF